MLAILMTISFSTAVAQLPPQADSLFYYDKAATLSMRDSLIESGEHHKVFDVSFSSPRGGRVTAYLVTPARKGRFPGIVFGHWGLGDKTEFLPEAKLYAEAGCVSLMIDYPWVRPAPWRVNQGSGMDEPEKDLAVFAQAVVDLRRGLDVLASRDDVDREKIAYVGHSYGAQWGVILSAVEKRIKAVVLMAGVPSDSAIFLEGNDPTYVAWRERTPKETMARYFAVTNTVAAIRYVAHAKPTPLFFQFARKERVFRIPAMERYYAVASEPKRLKWYDTGHELNDVQALLDRAEWLHEQIGIKSVKPFLQKRLK
jgi:dienelactone hydrolase